VHKVDWFSESPLIGRSLQCTYNGKHIVPWQLAIKTLKSFPKKVAFFFTFEATFSFPGLLRF
jgi:hypothetical protein